MFLWRRLTPVASPRTRLFAAAFVWTAVGAGLLAAGLAWIVGSPSAAWLAAIPAALAVGWAKGRFVLAPRARANTRRIAAAGEARCVGGAFSWGSWLLAIGMMAGGMLLRRSPIPRPWLGLVYTTVGIALLAASAHAWSGWWGARAENGAPPRG